MPTSTVPPRLSTLAFADPQDARGSSRVPVPASAGRPLSSAPRDLTVEVVGAARSRGLAERKDETWSTSLLVVVGGGVVHEWYADGFGAPAAEQHHHARRLRLPLVADGRRRSQGGSRRQPRPVRGGRPAYWRAVVVKTSMWPYDDAWADRQYRDLGYLGLHALLDLAGPGFELTGRGRSLP